MNSMIEYLKFAKGIDPVADAFAGTKYSDVYSLEEHGHILFVVYAGDGATGTSQITVEACLDVAPSAAERQAVPFIYREILDLDTDGAVLRAPAAGFATSAGSSRLVIVEAGAREQASTGWKYCRLKLVEDTNSPVVGAVLAIAGGAPARFLASKQRSILS